MSLACEGSIVPPGWSLKQAQRYLIEQNQKWPDQLRAVPESDWPSGRVSAGAVTVGCWRSRRFMVQVWQEGDHLRLSIHRTTLGNDGRWEDGITWDALQRLKREAGYGDRWAVEIYPADHGVVNVANIRHLWLLPAPPPFAWRQEP